MDDEYIVMTKPIANMLIDQQLGKAKRKQEAWQTAIKQLDELEPHYPEEVARLRARYELGDRTQELWTAIMNIE
jgi:hypothetical protein